MKHGSASALLKFEYFHYQGPREADRSRTANRDASASTLGSAISNDNLSQVRLPTRSPEITMSRFAQAGR
jgi:hypothetical protein